MSQTTTQTRTPGPRGGVGPQKLIRVTAGKVSSESDAGTVYNVQLPDCDCPDYRYRKGGRNYCKHLEDFEAATGTGWHNPADAALARQVEEILSLARGGNAVPSHRLITILTSAL